MQTEGNRTGRPSGVILDGELMRTRRRSLAMSQSDLANSARLGVRTIRAAEAGKPMSTDTAMQIAVALGTPYIVLMRRTPEETQSRLLERGYAPLEPPRLWMPRAEARQVVQWFANAEQGVQACVRGRPGIGKSALARRAVQELADSFPEGLVWVSAGNLADDQRVRRMQIDLAQCLGFLELLPDAELVPVEAFDRAFARRFWSRRRLLVLDDLSEFDDLARLLDPEQPHWVLVTTSFRFVAERIRGPQLHLEPWGNDTTLELFELVLGEQRLTGDPQGVQDLVALAGGVPLAARTVAEALKRRRYTTASAFVEGVKQSGLEGLDAHNQAKLGPLCVFQDQPFNVAFAAAVLGLGDAETRARLEELSDMYLLREAPGAETGNGGPRFQIDTGSRQSLWLASDAQEGMQRLLEKAPAVALEMSRGLPSLRQAEVLDASLPAWRIVLDEAARRVLGSEFDAARVPDQVPEALEGADFAQLPTLLRALSPMLLMRSPADSGRWLTAGMAAANASGDRVAQRELAALMMMWWWMRSQQFAAASEWGDVATRRALEVGDPDWAVSIIVFAAVPARYSRGDTAAIAQLEAGCSIAQVSPAERACLVACLGSLLLLDGQTERAEQLLSEALAILQQSDHHYPAVLQAEVLVNLSTARYITGKELPPSDRIAQALTEVQHVFAGSSLLEAQVVGLARMLGVKGDWKAPSAAEAFLAVPPELVNSRLLRLGQTAVDLGQTVGTPYPMYRGVVRTEHGVWSSVTTPLAPREGHPPLAMYLIVPIEPLQEMLKGKGIELALRFVESARGKDDPVYHALVGLAPTL